MSTLDELGELYFLEWTRIHPPIRQLVMPRLPRTISTDIFTLSTITIFNRPFQGKPSLSANTLQGLVQSNGTMEELQCSALLIDLPLPTSFGTMVCIGPATARQHPHTLILNITYLNYISYLEAMRCANMTCSRELDAQRWGRSRLPHYYPSHLLLLEVLPGNLDF